MFGETEVAIVSILIGETAGKARSGGLIGRLLIIRLRTAGT